MIEIKEIEYDQCPHCQKQFEKKDILEHFLNAKNDEKHNQHEFYKDYTDDEIYKVAEMYGYTKENPQYFENDITGIEYSRLYDGILIYQCNSCKHHWGRFSGIVDVDPKEEALFRYNSK